MGKKWLAVLLAAFLILGTASVGPAALRALAQEGEEPTPAPDPTKVPTAAPTEAPTPTPSPTPEPTETPEPEITQAPETAAPADPTAVPEETPGESAEPEATSTPNPEATKVPENTPKGEATPDPGDTLEPEETMDPMLEDQSPEAVEDKGGLVLRPKSKYSGWYGVMPSDERGMPIPILYQSDYTDIVCTVDGIARSVATSGCGATCVSMVTAYLTGNTEQTPYTLFYRAVQMGRYRGSGLDHETLSWLLRENGVKSSWISNDASAIKQALHDGKPVIAHMGPGIFTTQGHYIVLRGVTEDGKILVNDPYSASRTRKAYPIETLVTQARGSNAFLVCWTDAPEEEASDGSIQKPGASKGGGETPAQPVSVSKPEAEQPVAPMPIPLEPAVVSEAASEVNPRPTFEVVVDATLEPVT